MQDNTMASTSHSSMGANSSSETQTTSLSSPPPSYAEIRQQAGPLPSKRGELGFVEGVHVQVGNREAQTVTLPARHPADRDAPPSAGVSQADSSQAAPSSTGADVSSPPSSDESNSKPRILQFLKPKNVPLFGGVRLTTVLIFFAQILVFAACIAIWVFTAKKIASLSKSGSNVPGGTPSTIFIHVVFAFAVIGQLIFVERRIYRLRAERYAYLHPGEMLPRYRDRVQPGGDLSFAYAPWNRPPLPTYAAALAQSGHGTGDADDHLIAVPPPPAYGNTRGSRMLLQGFLTEELRAQRPVSVHSQPDLERGERRPSQDGGSSSPEEGNRVESQRERALARLQSSTTGNRN